MSKKNTQTPISKATDVAEDIHNDGDQENLIASEFIIVSSDEQSGMENNVLASNEIVVISSMTEEKNHRSESSNSTRNHAHQDELSTMSSGKKPSSKDQKKRKGGPNTKMLSLIRQLQEDRINAELEANAEAKRIQRSEEEKAHKKQEKLRLEKERRDRIREKEKKRIQRQREDGTYLTKEQRKKAQRAQIQLGAVGIQVPTCHVSQLVTPNNDEASKRRILYNDRRIKNAALSSALIQSVLASAESAKQVPIDEEDSSTDSWEHLSEDKNIHDGTHQTLSSREDSDNDYLHAVIDNESSESKSVDNDEEEKDQSLLPLEQYQDLGESHRSSEVLRAPVICVLGHVDAGKTTILDNLRQTHVQKQEAGGITQQIGATNVPLETIHERTQMCRKIISREGDFIVPGLLIIDTPGHEAFKNLRLRGSSLCDLAILVVDIMHGLAPQTIESIQLLTERRTPFIVALNKIDLLYGWKSNNEKDVELVLQEQSTFTQNHFEQRCNHIIVQFAEQGLNVALYNKNSDPNEFYSMVPTSARSGDGMGSLIALIIEKCQTTLAKRITYTDNLQATVMEVKTNDGIGTTIDVVLVNGCLSVGDKIVIAGQEAPIVTRIRGLLIPESNQELRVTDQYQTNATIKGACGIKILAKDLEKSMAGFSLFVVRNEEEVDYYKNELESMLKSALNSIEVKDKGVYVQASTLGSLEAFLQLLKTSHIPYSGINIGPVHRKDVIRASAQLEKDAEWATILAFDVRIEKDAQEYAHSIGVKIFQHDEVYPLRDMFKSYREEMKKVNQEKYRHLAVFPCKLRILPPCVFNSRDPILCGVRIEDGFIKIGTPICVPSKDCIELGRIVSIEKNHKSLEIAPKGSEVCIKITPITGETPKMYGRHFDDNDILMSKISRESIDVVKTYFREEMQSSDWKLIIELKKIFQII